MKRFLIIFVLVADSLFAANFGDIPANLALPAGTSVRRNAGDTLFESFTPGSGGGAVSSVFGRTGAVVAVSGDYTAAQVGLGNVTNDAQTKAAIVPNTAPTSGQILVGNAGGTAYVPVTLSGSGTTATLSSAGVLTLSAIPNATLSNSAITIAGTSTSLGGSITLDTISGVSSNGFLKRTGANTWTNDASTYLTGNQTITLSGDVTGSGATAITTTVKNDLGLGGNPTTTTQSSTDNSTRIATTAYVTTGIANAVAGVNPAVAVQAATTAASDTSSFVYSNGVGGIGATLTGPTANVAITIDGYTFTALGQRLLVKNDTQSPSGAFNGVYYLTTLQAVAIKPVLTRALDYNQPSDINNTGAIPVVNGTVNANTSWLLTSSVTTVGTDPLTYVQFSINPTTIVTTARTLTIDGVTQDLSANRTWWTVVFSTPGGRLTTESGVPVSTSDRTAQGTLYYTPYKHNNVFTYSGSNWEAKTFSEISLALTVTSGKNYDVFINSVATTLSLSNAWTNDTTRADALATQDGVTVLSSDHTKLWLGTIRADGTNTIADSAGGSTTQVGGKRYVWNAYNQVLRRIAVIDTTGTWSYTTDTIRQANAAAGNKVEYVTGDVAMQVDATVHGDVAILNNVLKAAKVGVGVDSTTTFSGLVQGGYNNVSATNYLYAPVFGRYVGTPGLGYHYLSWNEKGADGSCVFIGNNSGDSQQTGLIATGQM